MFYLFGFQVIDKEELVFKPVRQPEYGCAVHVRVIVQAFIKLFNQK